MSSGWATQPSHCARSENRRPSRPPPQVPRAASDYAAAAHWRPATGTREAAIAAARRRVCTGVSNAARGRCAANGAVATRGVAVRVRFSH